MAEPDRTLYVRTHWVFRSRNSADASIAFSFLSANVRWFDTPVSWPPVRPRRVAN